MKLEVNYKLEYFASSSPQPAQSKKDIFHWCNITNGNTPETATMTVSHTHMFNGPFSGTTQVSRYQKGKTNLDFTEARDSERQWHQLSFFTGRMLFLPPNQQRQSTEGK